MVIRTKTAQNRAALMTELLVAMAILTGVLVPLGWALASERRLARSLYQHAVAMELVDGELETLLAGEWRAYGPGKHEYRVTAQSATNLPPGKFALTVESNVIQLEWRPEVKHHGGAVIREGRLQ
jgi:hypothetical protein